MRFPYLSAGGLQTARAHQGQILSLPRQRPAKSIAFLSAFPTYVCPEPVLVKKIVLVKKLAHDGDFRTCVSASFVIESEHRHRDIGFRDRDIRFEQNSVSQELLVIRSFFKKAT
jgi:hypothetical protein